MKQRCWWAHRASGVNCNVIVITQLWVCVYFLQSVFSLLRLKYLRALVWILTETDSKTKIQGQVVYLGGNLSRKVRCKTEKGMQTIKGFIIKEVITGAQFLLGNSVKISEPQRDPTKQWRRWKLVNLLFSHTLARAAVRDWFPGTWPLPCKQGSKLSWLAREYLLGEKKKRKTMPEMAVGPLVKEKVFGRALVAPHSAHGVPWLTSGLKLIPQRIADRKWGSSLDFDLDSSTRSWWKA